MSLVMDEGGMVREPRGIGEGGGRDGEGAQRHW